MTLNLLLLIPAVLAALALRPWRGVAPAGPPWPWLAWCAVLPLFWGADKIAQAPIVQPLSGAALLVLMAGWPLAVLALLPVAGVMVVVGGLPLPEALHRLVWLGLVPATLALAGGGWPASERQRERCGCWSSSVQWICAVGSPSAGFMVGFSPAGVARPLSVCRRAAPCCASPQNDWP